MHNIGSILSQVQDKMNQLIALNNHKATENKMGKAIACAAYRDYLLSKITDVLREIELEHLFDFVIYDQIWKWHGNTETGVTMCTIRDLSKITLQTVKCDIT
ncbi:hypothetical protein FKM82_021452 [Ascaphus truei]